MDETKSSDPLLGWNVGGTRSSAVIGSAAGDILDRREWSTGAGGGFEPALGDFVEHARSLVNAHTGVKALGVSVGGPLDTNTGTVLSPPHLPGWDRVPLADILEKEFDLPVCVEHDAAACLLAEWFWGAAKGATHAVYLTCGTGCGAGILIDGNILRGPKGQSPEAGHVRLAPDGPMMFGKEGSAESFCSGEGIAKLASFMCPERFPGPVETQELQRLAAGGDNEARSVLDESAARTGQLCALLADIFCPEVIVLGSLARYFGENWIEKVRAAFADEGLPINTADTTITAAALGERLQDLSAIAPCVKRV